MYLHPQKYEPKLVLSFYPSMEIIRKLISIGISAQTDQFDRKRIMLLNIFSFVAVVALVAAFLQSLFSGEDQLFRVVLGAGAFLFALNPLLVVKHSHFAGVIMLLVSNCILSFFVNTQGIASGAYLYLFPLLLVNGWLMDFRKPLYSSVLFLITLASVISMLVFPSPIIHIAISEEVLRASFHFNVVAASLVMVANTVAIAFISYRQHLELDKRMTQTEIATAELNSALKEKDVLLAEIHHRVKNNLAVVKSLLNLQMNSTTNEVAKATLLESMNRVGSMALIHHKLYGDNNPNAIDFGKYASELVDEIASSYSQDGFIPPTVDLEIEETILNLNKAVPCGLILNELLSNSFKHAFEKGQAGNIRISIGNLNGIVPKVTLTVADNGKGFDPALYSADSTSLGMTIIDSLCGQLDGKFSYDTHPGAGTKASLIFPS